jgi:hypothetical protein
MNKDQLIGKFEELKGRARQAFGRGKEAASDAGKSASSEWEREKEAAREKLDERREGTSIRPEEEDED